MKASIVFALAFGCLLAIPAVQAQQSAAPAGSTGQCKDGSYTSNATRRGACRGHKGVKEWYAADSAPAKAAKKSSKKAPAAEAAAPAASAPAAAPAAAPKKSMTWARPAATAAPGGGPGMVWVNSGSKVYHCPGDKWYGKTRHGEYMSEADAKAKGNHPEHGKACKP
ncbi:DUF3761 domain-containing protein [Rhodanobacter aciditrophus]|uniref:DUF3761 domain-containing protein n=1 Tax=Rhodanobacter aciditrophus TaxID=1623218 RepID=UPI003CEC2AED